MPLLLFICCLLISCSQQPPNSVKPSAFNGIQIQKSDLQPTDVRLSRDLSTSDVLIFTANDQQLIEDFQVTTTCGEIQHTRQYKKVHTMNVLGLIPEEILKTNTETKCQFEFLLDGEHVLLGERSIAIAGNYFEIFLSSDRGGEIPTSQILMEEDLSKIFIRNQVPQNGSVKLQCENFEVSLETNSLAYVSLHDFVDNYIKYQKDPFQPDPRALMPVQNCQLKYASHGQSYFFISPTYHIQFISDVDVKAQIVLNFLDRQDHNIRLYEYHMYNPYDFPVTIGLRNNTRPSYQLAVIWDPGDGRHLSRRASLYQDLFKVHYSLPTHVQHKQMGDFLVLNIPAKEKIGFHAYLPAGKCLQRPLGDYSIALPVLYELANHGNYNFETYLAKANLQDHELENFSPGTKIPTDQIRGVRHNYSTSVHQYLFNPHNLNTNKFLNLKLGSNQHWNCR